MDDVDLTAVCEDSPNRTMTNAMTEPATVVEMPRPAADAPPPQHRWVFHYAVDGDLRFISHHDTLRLFARALARAALPVRFSAGFNPHPRVTIPLPRPVGIASSAEAVVVEFEKAIDAEDAVTRLNATMPAGLRILHARRLSAGERLQPALVRYCLSPCVELAANLPSRIRSLLESDVVQTQRSSPKKAKPVSVNIRPYVAELHTDGHVVEFSLHVTAAGAAKPSEIAGLLGFDAASINHRIRRLEIQWR